MANEEFPAEVDGAWKTRTLVLGGLIGALTGLGLAYLMIQRAEEQGGEVSLSPGESVRLGLSVLGLMRQVADLAEPDE